MDFNPRINLLLCSAVNQAANTSSLAGALPDMPAAASWLIPAHG